MFQSRLNLVVPLVSPCDCKATFKNRPRTDSPELPRTSVGNGIGCGSSFTGVHGRVPTSSTATVELVVLDVAVNADSGSPLTTCNGACAAS